jgi:hypothetical protein
MRLLGKPGRICEDNIKTDLREYEEEGVDWIDLAQDINRWRPVLNKIMNLSV